MRGREFTMKDAYSFDRSPEAALESYRRMFDAYVRIFDRLGLTYRAVAADTGSIGGSASHEFQVIADTGEDALVYSTGSDYAANIEMAEALPLIAERAAPAEALVRTATPGQARCADWPAFWACRWIAPSSRSCWRPRRRPARGSLRKSRSGC